MKIYVEIPDENKSIHVFIPNALILNRLSLYVIGTAMKKSLPISVGQLNELAKVFKRSVREFDHFEFVHVESKDGEIIHIEV